MTATAALLVGLLLPLFPVPAPPPFPDPDYTSLLPRYVTNGDGTRMQCTPSLNQCWPDSTGLPSYLPGG